jgi:asparagine synthase (glutamine-hydrolysing)
MCGIAGIIKLDKEVSHEELLIMSQKLVHRGPDDSGIWINGNIGFAHRRLSVIDLTLAGHQPMHSFSDRYTIVFNGEIYNHLELRKQLNFVDWNGKSDTETLLVCIELWGLDKTLNKINGMFSFALWDSEKKITHLTRDRVGEKPLYYGWQGENFLFGSELKSLKAHPKFQANIDRKSLSLYFRFNYIPTPYSIYENIYKLQPGSVLSLRQGEKKYKIRKYWSIEDRAISSVHNSLSGSEDDLINELEHHITRSIKQKMVSDVPLGAFLSGGIDSSIVVGIMQSLSSQPIKTFTIGFEDEVFDEAKDARLIAKHFGTDHHELYVTAQDVIDVIPLLPSLYDEPFSDASQIPTYLVSKLAKQEVTVSLSGDGGDELFCGYNRYHITKELWDKISKLPLFVRKYVSLFLLSIPIKIWNKFEFFSLISGKYNNLGVKIHKGARVLHSNSLMELYGNLLSNWKVSDGLVLGGHDVKIQNLSSSNRIANFSNIEKMMLWDFQSYLPDDILVKLDRASMGCSLEGRVPFLDHDLIEFSWRVPVEYKYRDKKGKWILRQVLHKYVPKKLIDRPKSGFTLPLANWLRGDLKVWAESLINTERLNREGILNADIVSKKWKEHQAGDNDWSNQLWSVLMFQSWLEVNGK